MVYIKHDNHSLTQVQVEWREGVSLIVVTVSEGYPGSYTKGQLITGLKEAEANPGVKVSAKRLKKMF